MRKSFICCIATITCACMAAAALAGTPKALTNGARDWHPQATHLEGEVVQAVPDGSPRGPAIFTTGWETTDAPPFTAADLQGQNGWTRSDLDTTWCRVSTTLPFAGTQSLRMIFDPSTGAGTFRNAIGPNMGPQPVSASTFATQLRISNTGGADYEIAITTGALGFVTRMHFVYNDFAGLAGPDITVLDNQGAGVVLADVDSGTPWVPGAYRAVRIDFIPAADQIDYYYGGTLIHRGVYPFPAQQTTETIILRTDNFQFPTATEACNWDNTSIAAFTTTGACCSESDGTCNDNVSPDACTLTLGTFYPGQTCGVEFQCIGGPGACCVQGECTLETFPDCDAMGGTFQGSNTACGATPCPPACEAGSSGQPLIPGVGFGVDGTIATVSDINPNYANFTAAENINPTVSGNITKIRWWGLTLGVGGGFPACTPQTGDSPDDFTITVWNDALDLPFQIVAGPFAQGTDFTLAKTDTGLQFAGRNYLMFEATGLNVAVDADTCYWIEIVNHLTGQCTFLWSVADLGDGKSATGADDMFQSGDENDFDLAICVDIEIHPDGGDSCIEIPGACCMNLGTSCIDNDGPGNCLGAGGTFLGFLTTCSPTSCQGACCEFNTNACTVVIQNDCPGGSTFQGIGAPCTPDPCSGACCLDQGNCQVTTKFQCEASLDIGGFGGSFTGGATCAQVTCATDEICLANVMACNSSITVNNASQAEFQRFDPLFDATIPQLSCYGGVGGDNGVGSFWLTFTGTGMDVEVSTCNSAVNDTVMAVYQDNGGGCGNITAADEVACSEDDDSCLPSFNSKVCVPTINGTQYWIQVTSFDEFSVGSITVDVTCPCPVAGCTTCPGDVSGDGELDGEDIAGFVSCLLGGGSNCVCGDTNADTVTNLGDIPSFVNLLLTSTGACP